MGRRGIRRRFRRLGREFLASVGVRLEGLVVFKIERRPRGASRINPLLHLLQRAMACQAMVVRLGARRNIATRHPHQPKNHVASTRQATMAYQT